MKERLSLLHRVTKKMHDDQNLEETTTFTMRLPVELLSHWMDYASEHEVSTNRMLVALIEEALREAGIIE